MGRGLNAPEALQIKEAAAAHHDVARLKNCFHKLLPDQQNPLSSENIAPSLLFASLLPILIASNWFIFISSDFNWFISQKPALAQQLWGEAFLRETLQVL